MDEGHRLKNKDSKLFLMLKQYHSLHRVLLTGTPLQVLLSYPSIGAVGVHSVGHFSIYFKDASTFPFSCGWL